MKTDFSNSAFKRLATLESDLTKLLRKDALVAGWPEAVVSTLSVRISKNDMSVEYPDFLADVVEDLEYGDGSTSPKSVLRKFATKHNTLLENTVSEWSIDYLFATGVLP